MSCSWPEPLHPQREKNFFIVSGLPRHFNWQKLKDLVRDATKNQPGWTNMDESWQGAEGATGYFSVKSDQDAASVYRFLVSLMCVRLGQPLLVHHFDASCRDPVLLMCNCSKYYHGATGHSDDRSCITVRSVLAAQNIIDWQSIAPVSLFTIPIQPPALMLPLATAPMAIYSVMDAYQSPVPTVEVPPGLLMTNGHGLPVNIANGIVRTESRGVHISGLPYGVPETEIRELVRPYGRVQGVEMRKNHCVVHFGSAVEFRQVIEGLDRVMWKGRQIMVKEDRDLTSVSEAGIVIANGGPRQGSGYRT